MGCSIMRLAEVQNERQLPPQLLGLMLGGCDLPEKT